MGRARKVRVIYRKPVKTYQLDYFNGAGRRRRISVGRDREFAYRMRREFEEWLWEGKDPERELAKLEAQRKRQSVTLREYFPIFVERHKQNIGSRMLESYTNSFKNVSRCPELAEVPLDQIRKSTLIDYMRTRMEREGVKPATVNREAAFVKCALFRAVEWDILEHNPLEGFRMLREAEKREVLLTPDKAGKLLDALPNPRMRQIVEFAIYTGFRKENILNLRIENIILHDLQPTGVATLIVKGGRKEKFPIGSLAVDVLKRAIQRKTHGFVFVNPRSKTRYYSIHRTFNRAVRKIGLKVGDTNFRFHDLRHVYATWLHQQGISLDLIRPLLGHRDIKTTERYTTHDRLAMSKVLELLPKIKRSA